MRRLYVVTYDISDPRRWRRVYRAMRGYGEWLQLSVFQCDLSETQRLQLESLLDDAIHHNEDQVLFIDLGPIDGRPIKSIEALGRPLPVVERGPRVV